MVIYQKARIHADIFHVGQLRFQRRAARVKQREAEHLSNVVVSIPCNSATASAIPVDCRSTRTSHFFEYQLAAYACCDDTVLVLSHVDRMRSKQAASAGLSPQLCLGTKERKCFPFSPSSLDGELLALLCSSLKDSSPNLFGRLRKL